MQKGQYMKLKFKQTCKDKHTGQKYVVNEIYEFEDERAQEILETGLAEIVDEPVKEIDKLEEALEKGYMVNLYDLTLAELKKLAKEEGVSASGKKDDIIERILKAHDND